MTAKPYSFAWLNKQTDDQIIQLFDNISTSPPADPQFYLNVLQMRAQSRVNAKMLWITIAIGGLTFVNVVLVGVSLWPQIC